MSMINEAGRTLAGARSESEGVVFSELAETVFRPWAGDGVVPQVVEEAHMDQAYFSRSGVWRSQR